MKGYKVRRSNLRELDNASFAIALIVVVVTVITIFSISFANNPRKDESISSQSEPVSQSIGIEETPQSVDTEEIPQPTNESNSNDGIKAPSNLSTYFKVIKVVDGDTIDVYDNGSTIRVRLIGVNTPETVHPEKAVECFGKEASTYTTKKLLGKNVQLETDSSQDKYDTYSRLLAYVYVDGDNFNYSLIYDGYAYEYTYNTPYKYQAEFKAAQRDADANNRGLWNPSACNGKR